MVFLPDPVAARPCACDSETGEVRFVIRDAAHRDAFEALFDKALKEGYAVEIKLLHYSGCPDMVQQAAARKARKQQAAAALFEEER